MIPEYDQFPVFYYCNHNSVMGPGEVLIEKDQLVNEPTGELVGIVKISPRLFNCMLHYAKEKFEDSLHIYKPLYRLRRHEIK